MFSISDLVSVYTFIKLHDVATEKLASTSNYGFYEWNLYHYHILSRVDKFYVNIKYFHEIILIKS